MAAATQDDQPAGSWERIVAAEVQVGDVIARVRSHDPYRVAAIPARPGGYIDLEGGGRIRPRGTTPLWRWVEADAGTADAAQDDSPRPLQCPRCDHDESGCEAAVVVWINEPQVVPTDGRDWSQWEIVDGRPSGSADTDAGLVAYEADGCYVQCADCGHKFEDVEISLAFLGRWTYDDTPAGGSQ